MSELYLFDLKTLIKNYQLESFVETGTGIGNGTKTAAKAPFNKLYSIEIITELYYKAIEKFKDDERITLINKDSINGLIQILEELKDRSNALFWLDAHFPGVRYNNKNQDNIIFTIHDEIDKDIKLPLEKELELILSYRPNNKDVFIIDDLCLYEDGNYELGNITEDMKYLREKYNLKGIKFIEDKFNITHNIEKIYRHQGLVLLTPLKRENDAVGLSDLSGS